MDGRQPLGFIETVGEHAAQLARRDLVRRTEKDMLETKNFGRKSLEEVQEVLDKLGLSLGMDVPERPTASV